MEGAGINNIHVQPPPYLPFQILNIFVLGLLELIRAKHALTKLWCSFREQSFQRLAFQEKDNYNSRINTGSPRSCDR